MTGGGVGGTSSRPRPVRRYVANLSRETDDSHLRLSTVPAAIDILSLM